MQNFFHCDQFYASSYSLYILYVLTNLFVEVPLFYIIFRIIISLIVLLSQSYLFYWSIIIFVIDVNECNDPNICPDKATCVNYPGSYNCECDPGYEGVTCQGMVYDSIVYQSPVSVGHRPAPRTYEQLTLSMTLLSSYKIMMIKEQQKMHR